MGLVLVGGVAGGGAYAVRMYDYVQHDNDFCMSCHLMADPFEAFAESAHRGLGCKACHQPNMIDRSQMALTQVIENPTELSIHAEVPNERCVTCHVDGDPERWRSIANSAGHKAHLESADSTLRDISCVECHSTSVHQFAPTTDTCAQSGCHEDSQLQLGAMSDLTVHCTGCHSYNAPVSDASGAAGVQTALSPTRNECFACHEMRTLVELPESDPHEGLCASCHNPHEQATPAEAVQTCGISGCHDTSEDLTPYHRGLAEEMLANCMSCHDAHDFHVDGADCLACHEDVFDDTGTPFPTDPRRIGSAVGAAQAVTLAFHGVGVEGSGRTEAANGSPAVWPVSVVGAARSWADAQADSLFFRHAEHRDVECTSCHAVDQAHGTLTVTTLGDCRSCHHAEPVSDDCAACHAAGTFVPPDTSRVHTMAFEVRNPSVRALPFDHDVHAGEDCAACHTQEGGLGLSAEPVSCSSCHEEHHEPGLQCRSCHVKAPLEEHPVEEVHVTCSGAGCHVESALDQVPRAREFCLACHQDLVEHKIEDDRDCAVCHTLPASRAAGGAP